MRLLLVHGHTLYAKVTLPLALRLLELGHEVVVERRRDRWHRFSDGYVRAHPTTTAIVDRRSLRFVARLTGYEREWDAAEERIEVRRVGAGERFDAVVGTTKDLERLRALASGGSMRAYALGYQHMPYLVTPGRPLPSEPDGSGSFFMRPNPLTDAHRFLELIGSDGAVPNGFSFLDRVVERRPAETPARDRVLIFHPGGYRNVVTAPGDSAKTCHAKQLAFFDRACVPALEAGLRAVIKVHPLRARHHDLEDVAEIAEAIEDRHGAARGTITCLGPEAWFWDDAFRSAFVVNYGSSSIYELWAAGIGSAVVCNFEGTARSRKFELFPSIMLDSHAQYAEFVREGRYASLELDPVAAETASAYAELCDGHATDRAGEIVTGNRG